MSLNHVIKSVAAVFAAATATLLAVGEASAQNRRQEVYISPSNHYVGYATRQMVLEGLSFSIEIRRINVTEGKSEVCVEFENFGNRDWEGGYRLTNRDDNTTFATVRVPEDGTRTRCELLPRASTYYLVLNSYD